MTSRLTERERRSSRSEEILERLSVGRVRRVDGEKRYGSLEEIKRDFFPHLYEREQQDLLRCAREDAETAGEEARAST